MGACLFVRTWGNGEVNVEKLKGCWPPHSAEDAEIRSLLRNCLFRPDSSKSNVELARDVAKVYADAEEEIQHYRLVSQDGIRLPCPSLRQDPTYLAFTLGKLEKVAAAAERVVKQYDRDDGEPNWEDALLNAVRNLKDVLEA